MVQPRSSLVIVDLIEKANKDLGGGLVAPTGKDLYTEAVVVAVGPGTVSAAGGVSETADLTIGQHVFMKYREPHPQSRDGNFKPINVGIEYREGNKTYYAYEQHRVLWVIAQKYEAPPPEVAASPIIH